MVLLGKLESAGGSSSLTTLKWRPHNSQVTYGAIELESAGGSSSLTTLKWRMVLLS